MGTMQINTKFLQQTGSGLLFLICLAMSLPANTTEPNLFRTQLLEAVEDFIAVETEELAAGGQGILTHKVRGLDTRLRLQTCQTPIDITTTQQSWLRKRTHLKVSCSLPEWSLLVGLELSLFREVLVARTAIERNTSLNDMTEFAERDILEIRNGYIDSVEGILGKVTKRNLVMGQIISPHLIKAEILVPRNSIVEVSAQIGTIAVSSQGVALENGAFGDIIKVRNKRSKKVIEARVVHPNKVEVHL